MAKFEPGSSGIGNDCSVYNHYPMGLMDSTYVLYRLGIAMKDCHSGDQSSNTGTDDIYSAGFYLLGFLASLQSRTWVPTSSSFAILESASPLLMLLWKNQDCYFAKTSFTQLQCQIVDTYQWSEVRIWHWPCLGTFLSWHPDPQTKKFCNFRSGF